VTVAELPTTRREADGSPVDAAEARQGWAEAARPVLEAVASTYNATISYADLADAVQATTGVVTTQQMRHWIGPVLARVTEDCLTRSEPVLSALCVKADGSVGAGYASAIEKVRGTRPDDPEMDAARERLACYQAYGATLPSDGGRPAFHGVERDRRERAALRASKVIPPRAACPTCHMQLLTSGICGTCD
jgi:hypothetical protein